MNLEELKKHTFIVIGYEHYNPLGVIRSLGENGIKPVVMILRQPIRIASLSKYIGELYRVDSNEEALEILLRDYGNEKFKPFVFPCDDNITEVVDQNYERLKDKFYISNAGKNGRITYFMDKWNILELAKKHGLNVARTWNVRRGEIPSDIVYPVITKPLTSYPDWKRDYYICHDENELKDAYSKIQRDDDLLLQQYINKKNELDIDGIVVGQGKKMLVTTANTYTYILPDYYSMEMVVTNFDDDDMREALQEMFAEIGYEGIFSAEFLINGEGYYFLEINFRNSTWSWASTKVGMNLPLLWAQGMLENDIPQNATKPVPENYIALAELSDFVHRVVKHKMISVRGWWKGVKKADCLYFYDKFDKKPAIYYCFSVICNGIWKRMRRHR